LTNLVFICIIIKTKFLRRLEIVAKNVKKFYDFVDDEDNNIYSDSSEYDEYENDTNYENEQNYYEEEPVEQEENYDVNNEYEDVEQEEYEENYENEEMLEEPKTSLPLKILMIVTYGVMLVCAAYGIYSFAQLFF
jgi:hypothetical protein